MTLIEHREVNKKEVFILETSLGKLVTHSLGNDLKREWIILLSTRYENGKCATVNDMMNQILHVLESHTEILYCERLVINFGSLDEPTWNMDIITTLMVISQEIPLYDGRFGCEIFPTLTTTRPVENHKLEVFLKAWDTVISQRYNEPRP